MGDTRSGSQGEAGDFGLALGGGLIKAAGLGYCEMCHLPVRLAQALMQLCFIHWGSMLPVGSMKQSWTRLLR